MYEVPFTVTTPPSFYTQLDAIEGERKEILAKEIHQDLARFLGTDTIETLRQDDYRDLLLAVQKAFRKIEDEGIIDFSRYPKRVKAKA